MDLIIGLGNTLRGDDGLGCLVVEEIDHEAARLGLSVRALVLPQLHVSLVSEFARADRVVIVDARIDGGETLVTTQRVEAADGPVSASHSSHSVGIPLLLRITRDWYGASPSCHVVAAQGYDFAIGLGLSAGALVAAQAARDQALHLLGA